MYETEKFHLFYSGPFSQWAIRKMIVDGVEYNCCEQYMMAGKAKMFGDDFILKKIMAERNPENQKALGRMVKGFVPATWDANARDIVYVGNYHKFTQNQDCLDILKKTGDKIIVEASPTDRIWGIGLHERDPRAVDPSRWLGTNWLGECIMKVRAKLQEEGKL